MPWTSLLLSGPRAAFTDGLAVELDAVGVVNDAIEDGVGVGGLADEVVPCVDRRLAGADGGAAAVALLNDFEEVLSGWGIERSKAEIVQDEDIDPRQRLEKPGVAAIAAGERQIVEQLRYALSCAANASPRRDQRQAGLSGCSLGNQVRGSCRSYCAETIEASANSKPRSAGV